MKVNPQQPAIFGMVLCFIAAICFSAKAIFAKLAYAQAPDLDGLTLLALRMGLSLPFFVLSMAWLYLKNRKDPNAMEPLSRKDWLKLCVLGSLGFYLAGLLDFMGLMYISAALERLILFLYPTLVVILSFVFFKQKLSKRDMIALLLTYAGISLAFIHDIQIEAETKNILIGSLFVLLSAISFAFYLTGSGQVVQRVGSVRFTAIAMIISTIVTFLQFGMTYPMHHLLHYDAKVYWLAGLMAIFSTALPSLLFAEGMRRIGANHAAMINTIGPVATIFLAYIYLDEPVGGIQIAGAGLVLTGVLLIKPKSKNNTSQTPETGVEVDGTIMPVTETEIAENDEGAFVGLNPSNNLDQSIATKKC